MKFWAHSDPSGLPPQNPNAHWQPLSQHLENVSSLARQLALLAAPGNADLHRLAEICGLLHDFGKYSDAFQQMITTGMGRCQHSVHGACIALFGAGQAPAPMATHVSLAIAGHHAGLPDIKGGESSLEARVTKHRADAAALIERAKTDCTRIHDLLSASFPKPNVAVEQNFDLFTRMLFSCLIDADRLDSAGRQMIQQPLNAAERLQKLLNHVESISRDSPEGAVKQARAEVLRDCLTAADFPEQLLSLTVPTGGGKTFASMACALKRAALKPETYRRIIVVIPYLSIIEQNAERYEEVFGRDAVLEHHSGSFDRLVAKDDQHFAPAPGDQDEQSYEAARQHPETDNWDAPLIVTTSVRFFESLFSNRPSDLRRVHNIARSIVILDEVQTLPRRLLAPLLAMIRDLSRHWGCTFIFSTATQPAFQRTPDAPPDSRWEHGVIREIVRQPQTLRFSLRRVNIEWEIETAAAWPELARRILKQRQALAVVNVRDHASELYDAVSFEAGAQGLPADSIFHLSTRMCAAHRLDVLGEITRRLKQNLPCWVISTQLIEAGVDLDFPVVFRALGPLDSIFQAAGRADREGRLTERLGAPGGRVVVFLPLQHKLSPNEYKEATGKTEALARELHPQVDSSVAIEAYFERYYGEGGDLGEALQKHRTREGHFRFATLADEFEMISNRTRDVFVPYGENARSAIEELRKIKKLTRELRRRLQRYVVGLYPNEFQKARGVLEQIGTETEVWVAVVQAYSPVKGLKFEIEPAHYIA
jgi:CRISPR-associated endonuclease/helicase Cas3